MTEPAPTATERCTSILLPEIMDYLVLWDILRAMGVNRLWREHAINHPTYYGRLYLIQHYPLEKVHFFLLRLSRSSGRPISVYVDLDEQIPLSVMQEIGTHLAHIASLTLYISLRHSAVAVLEHLCHPAPILRQLKLCIGVDEELRPWNTPTAAPPPLIIPAGLLAGGGPALEAISVTNVDLFLGIPQCFSNIRALSFYNVGWHESELVLPNLFERCPKIRALHLGNSVTLHPDACHATHAWKRMTKVSFSGSIVGSRWPAFGLPLHDVERVTVAYGDAASVLALADTISGLLHLTFSLPYRRPPVPSDSDPAPRRMFYTAVLRSMSQTGDYSRMFEDELSDQRSIFAFSTPSLADRIIRLELALHAWDAFVGLSTFGPFSMLDELVLNLNDNTEFQCTAALPKLSCPRLQRLVLSHGARPTLTIDVAAVAGFALASLSVARFPLRLKLDGVALAGAWNDFPETFSGCICR